MKYTPDKITKENLFYTIPIYQRLFEWDTENIVTLLEDLIKEYKHTEGQGDYYIGMLTSTKYNELVDGQQRFTVLMLLGCVLQEYYDEWGRFLVTDNKPRLDFTSRPLDNTYLRFLMDGKGKEEESRTFKNPKMQNGYRQIRTFMIRAFMKEKAPEEKRRSFASYIFHHLCFFVSNLPEEYSPRDLNKYFERMNTTGKNLEQHEILKVKLLSNLDNDVDKYMLLWNRLSDVDTLLIRERKGENLEEVKRQALKSGITTIFSGSLINGMNGDVHDDSTSIGEIPASDSVPNNERELIKDSHCALTFPYLLLQVLYRKLDGKIKCAISDFFKPNNLLSIFEEYLPFSGNDVNKEDIKDFLERLFRARLALDICFIRPTEYGYSLDMNLPEDNAALRNLLMLQSNIYVSSSNYTNYRWFNWLMDVVDKDGIPNAEDFYKTLLDEIDKEFKVPPYDELSYKGDNRYWFWRLDFYIWQHRDDLFGKGSPEWRIADNYIFKRNRSIEHIAPQTPQSQSALQWTDSEEDARLRDSFGNLVMISQGLNSSLSNESYEVKAAHVQSYCNGSKSGSIESLKLLVAYKDYPNGWSKDTIEKHGREMYDRLKASVEVSNCSI